MTAPTLIRPPLARAMPSAWLTGIHRIEEGTLGTLDQRVDFVRNALALVQPMSVLALGSDAGLRERLTREGHAVYAGAIGQAASAGFPSQVQRITGVTHFFGYGDGALATDALPYLAGRLSPWGWMGIKVLDRDQLAAWMPEEEVLHRNGAWFRLKFRFDRRTGVVEVTSRALTRPSGHAGAALAPPSGASRLRLRAFTVTEIENLFHQGGLRLEAVFGGLNGETLERNGRDGRKAMYLVARKATGR